MATIVAQHARVPLGGVTLTDARGQKTDHLVYIKREWLILVNTLADAAAEAGGSLTVEEADGTPSGSASTLVFPNGSVSFAGPVATITLGGGGGTPGGANKQIQYNDAGSFGAEAGFEYDSATNAFTAPGTIIAGGNISGANLSGTNTGDQIASTVSIVDAGGYYTSTDVEGALQEAGPYVINGITRGQVQALLQLLTAP